MGTDGKRIVYPIRGMGQAARPLSRTSVRTALYVAAMAMTAIATAVALFAFGYGLTSPLVVALLAVAGAIGERTGIRLTDKLELSISGVPTIFASLWRLIAG